MSTSATTYNDLSPVFSPAAIHAYGGAFVNALLQQLSHCFDMAYLLMESSGRPALMSEAARRILLREDGLRLQHGMLCFERQEDQAQWTNLLACACASEAPAPGALVVSRAALQPLHLLLRPLPVSGDAPCALVLLCDTAERPASRAVVLRQVYRLLPSEIRLAESLAAGLDVKGAAALMHITENSARTLLKSVFRRMGVSSQSALLRAVLSLPAD